ncbi:hypothetical protein H257_17553 [Aphanomyces astaci]|uniref:B box-type domain-containing protein n=1 Tax=Aphanomyces astaci TaxID=112090 RepID=W4FEA5_APHAT|nr:hypothetical protein H257_17553 [Aphanomyces astaci]ETV65815.1 hypothetical protein H257_17553 [Aphanomyces astaci]|eukprot:XP_009844678.1 hypothetical protein H257_17553 [Aphanomyces astaci]
MIKSSEHLSISFQFPGLAERRLPHGEDQFWTTTVMNAPLLSSSFADTSAMCCKCVERATHSCVECDLLYCLVCSDQRHSKGSFQRHTVTTIAPALQSIQRGAFITCEECTQGHAVLHCSACELAYCSPCSKDIHRSGALQHHSRDCFHYLPLVSPAKSSPLQALSNNDTSLGTMWCRGGWSSRLLDNRPSSADSGVGYGGSGGGESPSFLSPHHSWTNPAHDTVSTSSSSSDGDTKSCLGEGGDDDGGRPSFTAAFMSLALEQQQQQQQQQSTLPETSQSAVEKLSWRHVTNNNNNLEDTSVLSRNQLEDLFEALGSSTPTRHVVVRSSGRQLTRHQVATLDHILHTFGQCAHYDTTFALSHGVVLYTYFDLRDAAKAVQSGSGTSTLLNQLIAVDFAVPVLTTSWSGSIVITVDISTANNQPRATLVRDIHAFCSEYADVASISRQNQANDDKAFLVELCDSRDVEPVLANMHNAIRGSFRGNFAVSSAEVAPVVVHPLATTFQAAAAAAIATGNPSFMHTPSITSTDEMWTTYGHYPPVPETWDDRGAPPLPPSPSPPYQPPCYYYYYYYNDMPPPLPRQTLTPSVVVVAPPPPNEYSLGIDRVGEDTRTTLMIRHIPNKYTQAMLLAEINGLGHHGAYDFFYLPIDFKNKCNMGYAFVNFMTTDAIVPFYKAFNGRRWRCFNSDKVCAITYARLQGKAAMVYRFQNSSLLDKHESYRPLVFKSSGPDKGAPELFPRTVSQWNRPSGLVADSGESTLPSSSSRPTPPLSSCVAPPPAHNHPIDRTTSTSTTTPTRGQYRTNIMHGRGPPSAYLPSSPPKTSHQVQCSSNSISITSMPPSSSSSPYDPSHGAIKSVHGGGRHDYLDAVTTNQPLALAALHA